jgi:hypothetical protein
LVLERNEKRKWKQIEANELKNMYDQYQFPTESEKTYYYKVFEVTNEAFTHTINLGSEYIKQLHGS